jgi:hypothetical protein
MNLTHRWRAGAGSDGRIEGREVRKDIRIEIAELTGPWGDILIVELIL